MAALDFGMALARGMLPKLETAQKDLINLAGGRSVFKSEDWWNKAVDKQISSGYREFDRTATEYLMPSGEYKREETRTSSVFQRDPLGRIINFGGINPGVYYASIDPVWGRISGYTAPAGTSTSYVAPEGAVFTLDPKTKEKQYTTRNIDLFNTTRKDYTAGQLKDIETAARRGAEQAKRTAAETKGSKRRLAKATGGLMGKARTTGEAPATGLPALGEGGLGITESILGGGIKL